MSAPDYTSRGGFRFARSTRPASIGNIGRRSIAPASFRSHQPTKDQLREELAQAARNTADAAKDRPSYSARNYPL